MSRRRPHAGVHLHDRGQARLLRCLPDVPPPRRPRRPDSAPGHSPSEAAYDLRHSFAVNTVLDAYRNGVDVQARLPLLSTYLGHVNPATTYWYLSAAPELLGLAGQRLEAALASQQ